MKSNVIAIIGQAIDPHVGSVCGELRKMGANPAVFERSRDRVSLNLLKGSPSGYLSIKDEGQIDFERIGSIWYRHHEVCDHSSSDPAIRSEVRFAWSEWQNVLTSLSYYCAQGRWINSVTQGRMMQRKAVQHVFAAQVGLRLPDTEITNDVNSARSLFERHSRVIYKPQNMPVLTNGRIVYAVRVDATMIDSHADDIKSAPCLFQEQIERDHELRITVVRDRIFAVRIGVPSTNTVVDRRQFRTVPGMYETASLDTAFAKQILDFHRMAGLVYGSYDVIVTPSGEHIFLEVNPMGEFMEFERKLNLPISREIALTLVEAAATSH